MGVALKDRNGNLLTRPISHAMTDAQARTAVDNAIKDGTITQYLGYPCTDPVVIASSDGLNVFTGEYCDPANGTIYDSSSYVNNVRSDYLPVEEGNVLITTQAVNYIYFDSQKSYVSGGNISSLPGYTGTQEENRITIPSGVSFCIINFYAEYGIYAVTLENTSDPDVVVLGDSIYGIAPYPYNPVYFASKVMKRRIANCAFGGTTAGQHYSSDYDKYTFHHIADCIASGDFSSMADFTGMPAIYKFNRATLTGIDWSKVKVVCIAYGTNDWNGNTTLDNSQNAKDTATYMGALRYGMEKIWSEYPDIQFVLFSPIYRKTTNYSADSDSAVNQQGKKLTDFVDGMESVAEEYHQNFFNHYNIGFNSINADEVFRDGTHLSYDLGSPILGHRSGKEIEMVLW